ncbi:MAG: GerMN domain-containing protein [Candidatus Magasanikbacteria bacterium]|nr:GerMN domain-containing protein [Candidatus Magasanikbacteria bacterium]
MSKNLIIGLLVGFIAILVVSFVVFLAVPKINNLVSDEVKEMVKEQNIQDIQEDNIEKEDDSIISIFSPNVGSTISSPLEITGEARGYWFFEGDFPVSLEDSNGYVIATGFATAGGDWMTEEMVPFTSNLVYVTPMSNNGVLVLTKDNPSGLPENDDELRIPIIFDKSTITLKVYFPNSNVNNDCQDVLGIERKVPTTLGVAKAAIEELLKGLTAEEINTGYTTNLNEGVKLNGISISNGTAYADFDSNLEYQVGGSCRIMGIYAQIEETLKQFVTVDSVVISINGSTADILQP